MKKRIVGLAAILLIMIALSACGGGSAAEPTPTPEGEIVEMPLGGYTFQTIPSYTQEDDGQVVNLHKEDNSINIMLIGLLEYNPFYTPDEIIDSFLAGISSETADVFEKSKPYPITIDSVEGVSFDLNGTLYGEKVQGQTFIVIPSSTQILFGFGLGAIRSGNNHWEKEGKAVFGNLLDSITLTDVNASNSGLFSACPVASDPDYGYTMDNPVKIGGGEAEAEARAEAYFSALGGPYGDTITYQKTDSMELDGAAMNIYEVSLSDSTKTMYLDYTNYENPQAPDGFICWEEIPLAAP